MDKFSAVTKMLKLEKRFIRKFCFIPANNGVCTVSCAYFKRSRVVRRKVNPLSYEVIPPLCNFPWENYTVERLQKEMKELMQKQNLPKKWELE